MSYELSENELVLLDNLVYLKFNKKHDKVSDIIEDLKK